VSSGLKAIHARSLGPLERTRALRDDAIDSQGLANPW